MYILAYLLETGVQKNTEKLKICFLFFLLGHKFLSQGKKNMPHGSDNARSFNHWAMRELLRKHIFLKENIHKFHNIKIKNIKDFISICVPVKYIFSVNIHDGKILSSSIPVRSVLSLKVFVFLTIYLSFYFSQFS